MKQWFMRISLWGAIGFLIFFLGKHYFGQKNTSLQLSQTSFLKKINAQGFHKVTHYDLTCDEVFFLKEVMSYKKPYLRLFKDGETPMVLHAVQAFSPHKKMILWLLGKVTAYKDPWTIVSDKVHVDLKTLRCESQCATTGSSFLGHFKAKGFSFYDDKLVLRGPITLFLHDNL